MKLKRMHRWLSTFALAMVFMFITNSISALAYDGSQRMVLERDIQLDSSHSIHVYVDANVNYSYSDGVYGQINYVEISDGCGVGSDTVYVDELKLVDLTDGGVMTYWEKYYFLGIAGIYDYSGYITIYFQCDEYGDLSGWITYNAI